MQIDSNVWVQCIQITSHRSLSSNIFPKIRGADNFLFILADASIDGYLDDLWSNMEGLYGEQLYI